jgi:hypothetical protein
MNNLNYIKTLEFDSSLIKEVILWREVIAISLNDLIANKTKGSLKRKREAYDWIFIENQDFYEVCNFAYVDYHSVRVQAKIILGISNP